MTQTNPLRIGVLGAAKIVPSALTGPAHSVPEVTIAAVAARDPRRAEKFARKHHIPTVHASYDALIADPNLDAIYNPLPNSLHAEWTIKALRAGKHVLCEKPFASNGREAEAMAQAASESRCVLSEAFAYRYHPLADFMKETIANRVLGDVRHIDAEFSFLLPDPKNIRFRHDLAGGALMDGGCYPISLIRFLAGAEPTVVRAEAKTISPQVDYQMEAHLAFTDGRTARMKCALLSPALFRSNVSVKGTDGEMRVFNPYHPHWFHSARVKSGTENRRVTLRAENVYVYQLRAFAAAVRGEGALNTGPQDAVGNMRLIDAIYEKAGLKPRGE